MGDLGLANFTEVYHDVAYKARHYVCNLDVNNNGWNNLYFYVPSLMGEAMVTAISIRANNSASAHASSQIEGGMVFVTRDGNLMRGPVASDNHTVNFIATLWILQWTNPFHLPIRGGDIIEMYVPPADDSGSPSGDYTIEVDYQEI